MGLVNPRGLGAGALVGSAVLLAAFLAAGFLVAMITPNGVGDSSASVRP